MGAVLGFPDVDPSDAATGARLKRWRRVRGMAVDDLASRLHISPAQARLAETGRHHLTTRQIGAATSALHLPLWALVSDSPAH